MLTTKFSVRGASLKLLCPGERGVITQINTRQEALMQKLNQMELTLGRTIAIEQRFPRFIVRVGSRCHNLDQTMINALYVRLVD